MTRQAFIIAGELALFVAKLAIVAWLVVVVISDLEASR